MGTWAGAIVDGAQLADIKAAAEPLGISVAEDATVPLLIHVEAGLGSLVVPGFVEALSRELHCTVIGFFLQTTASVEEVEHWHDGKRLRHLCYSPDEGGWIAQDGAPQLWEADYFFAEDEGTNDDELWPSNLGDEVMDEDIERYNSARAARNPSLALDLLLGGNLEGLCKHFGIRPDKPGGAQRPKPSRKPVIWLAIVVLVLLLGLIGGALTTP